MSLLLALVLTLAAPRQESVDAWFPRLESESWEERDLAQRRLAAELGPADAARVRAAIVAGGAETRLRLAHVLADEDRLFGLAAGLAVDADEVVARAGLTALRSSSSTQSTMAWSPVTPVMPACRASPPPSAACVKPSAVYGSVAGMSPALRSWSRMRPVFGS